LGDCISRKPTTEAAMIGAGLLVAMVPHRPRAAVPNRISSAITLVRGTVLTTSDSEPRRKMTGTIGVSYSWAPPEGRALHVTGVQGRSVSRRDRPSGRSGHV